MAGFFSNLFGAGDTGKATKKAAEENIQVLGDYRDTASGLYDTGFDTANERIGEARGLYSGMSKRGLAGLDSYFDALGLNGAEGNARAVDQFQTAPGYDFRMEQGLQALDRRAAGRGMLASGNTNLDTIRFAQGLADQEYNSYLDRLSGLGSLYQQGVSGEANALGNLANLATGEAGARVGLESQYATGLMGANNQIAEADEMRSAAKRQGANNMLGVVGTLVGSAFSGGRTLGYGASGAPSFGMGTVY